MFSNLFQQSSDRIDVTVGLCHLAHSVSTQHCQGDRKTSCESELLQTFQKCIIEQLVHSVMHQKILNSKSLPNPQSNKTLRIDMESRWTNCCPVSWYNTMTNSKL